MWSDIATGGRQSGYVNSREEWEAEMMKCVEYFTRLWRERENREGGFDLIAQGKLRYNQDELNGIDTVPDALIRVLSGDNFGTQIVKFSGD